MLWRTFVLSRIQIPSRMTKAQAKHEQPDCHSYVGKIDKVQQTEK